MVHPSVSKIARQRRRDSHRAKGFTAGAVAAVALVAALAPIAGAGEPKNETPFTQTVEQTAAKPQPGMRVRHGRTGRVAGAYTTTLKGGVTVPRYWLGGS
jgi:hypothetical protein